MQRSRQSDPLFNRKHNDTPEARSRLRSYLDEIGRLDLLPVVQQAAENGLRERPSKVTPAANTIEIARADANLSRWLQLDGGQLVAIRRPIHVGGPPDTLCDSYYPMDLAQEIPGILNPAEDHQGVTRLMGERGYEEVRHVDELRWHSPTLGGKRGPGYPRRRRPCADPDRLHRRPRSLDDCDHPPW